MSGKLYFPSNKPRLPAPPASLRTKGALLSDYRKEGYEVFSLGPLYVYGEIPESLPEKFAQSKQPNQPNLKTESTQIIFDRTVVGSCLEWSNMLDVMDRESYLWFKQWIMAFTFMNREKKLALFPRIYSAPILDPIALTQRGRHVPDAIEIWSVATSKWSLVPATKKGILKNGDIPSQVAMMFGPPEQLTQMTVQSMGKDLKAVYDDTKRRT